MGDWQPKWEESDSKSRGWVEAEGKGLETGGGEQGLKDGEVGEVREG